MTDSSETRSPQQIADVLGVDPKAVRHWLRQQDWRGVTEKGKPWHLTPLQALLTYEEFLRRVQVLNHDLGSTKGADLDGLVRAELTIIPGRTEHITDSLWIQVDDPIGISTTDLVDDVVAAFGLGDGYSVEERTTRTQWGAGSGGYAALLELAPYLWEPVASGITGYVLRHLVGKLREPRRATPISEEDALYQARYRVALRYGDIAVDALVLTASSVTVRDGATTYKFEFQGPAGVSFKVTLTQRGSIEISRVQMLPERDAGAG